MAEKKSQNHSEDFKAGTIGRRIGYLLYFLFLSFVLSAGAISIIPQAFSADEQGYHSNGERTACIEEARALKKELIDKTYNYTIDQKTCDTPKWITLWNKRFLSLEKRCGSQNTISIDAITLRDHFISTVKQKCRKQTAHQ